MKVRRHHRDALAAFCLGVSFACAAPSVVLAKESAAYDRDAQKESGNQDNGNDPDDPAAPPPDIGGWAVPAPAAARSGKPQRRDVARGAPAPDKLETRAQRPVTGAASEAHKAKRIKP